MPVDEGHVVALCGGVGAAKLVQGLREAVPARRLTLVVNTADDDEFHGLHVSPDLDTALYGVAGLSPERRGWGRRGDTFRVLETLEELGEPAWFRLGDRDLATHLFRTSRLRRGWPLHRVVRELARALGVSVTILPMTNDPVLTRVRTAGGEIAFQEYFVARRARDRVRGFRYRGLGRARPAPGVVRALARASRIVLPPSNPYTSLLPILGVRGIRSAIRRSRAPVVAVSPIRGGRSVAGPLGSMLRAAGRTVSPASLHELYDGIVDGWIIDDRDRRAGRALGRSGAAWRGADIDLSSPAKRRAVARAVLDFARDLERESD